MLILKGEGGGGGGGGGGYIRRAILRPVPRLLTRRTFIAGRRRVRCRVGEDEKKNKEECWWRWIERVGGKVKKMEGECVGGEGRGGEGGEERGGRS